MLNEKKYLGYLMKPNPHWRRHFFSFSLFKSYFSPNVFFCRSSFFSGRFTLSILILSIVLAYYLLYLQAAYFSFFSFFFTLYTNHFLFLLLFTLLRFFSAFFFINSIVHLFPLITFSLNHSSSNFLLISSHQSVKCHTWCTIG